MQLKGVLIEDRKQDTLVYAGLLQVRITDWFFFKDEAEIKYLGLKDAIVKFNRTDSVWNQQFLLDYFTSPNTGKKKKQAGIQFNLKELEMQNVTFLKKDEWVGSDMSAYVGKLKLDADNLSLSGNKFEIKSLNIADPVISINNYKGFKPKILLADNTEIDVNNSATQWNTGQTIIKVGNLQITNGTFKSDNQNDTEPLPYFDGQHVLFTNINGEFKSAGFVGDTVYSKLKLTAKERSGFELKNLTADMKLTPQGMFFDNLTLETNRSKLGHYFSMTYNDMRDMGDFIHKVTMNADFADSYLDSDDIAFFVPSVKSWKKDISIKGKIRGTVDDLVGRDLLITAGNNTLLDGNVTLTGLPDINKTFIDFKANAFKTTYSDIVTFAPSIGNIRNPDLRKIQYLNFNGSFTGFVRDFVTFGTIQTNLGTVKTDLNMKLPVGSEPVYSGSISTTNFRLGEFLDEKTLGIVSLSGTVKGRGFNEKTLHTVVDAKINFADYNNYRYKNIVVKGKLDNFLFEGTTSIRDENADLDLNGIIDFNKKTPRFDLIGDVAQLNLKNLKLTKDSIGFSGKLNFNFTNLNIDNFLGTAKITDAVLTKNGIRVPFDSLIISAAYEDSVKTLRAVSNEFTALVAGDFTIKDLPNAFQYMLHKYYPAYISKPSSYPLNQAVDFDITTYNIDPYLALLDTTLKGFNNSHLSGSLNLSKNILNLTAFVPQYRYKNYTFDNVDLVAMGNADSLVLVGQTKTIKINDSLNIPLANFKIVAHDDSSRVIISAGANQGIEKANIDAMVLTYTDGVKILFNPSTFSINGKIWTIDESDLSFRRNNPTNGLLVLSEGIQKIVVKTQPSSIGNWNDIQVALTDLNLNDFAPYFLPKNRLEGLLSGTISIEDISNHLTITSNDIVTKELKMDNDSLGEVKASLSYDDKTKELQFKGNTVNTENQLKFNGNLFFGDAEQIKKNLIVINTKNYQISILERFLGTLFTDMQGYLTGDIKIEGDLSSPGVTGKGMLKDAGMRVIFTQCFYKIKDTEISITPNEIDLDGLVLTDTVTGNPIYLRGGIEHESFKNMFFNMDIGTQKPNTIGEENNLPVLLLNTTSKDNKQFYGFVKGTGSLSLLGPEDNMFMKIDASASTFDSSYVTIPSSNSRESGIADFLVERKYGRELKDSFVVEKTNNITYDVDITANPMVTVQVILDELTGDVIKGKGTGTLNIRSGTNEPLALRGRFDIQEGSYLFTFQSFFKKPFEIRKETDSYIEWNGDPYNANIKLEALYKAERVSFAPLAKLKQLSSGASIARGDVYVVAKLTDKLFKPNIEFSLDFPRTSIAVTDPELALIVQQLQKNTNEINKQATYLIVFNSFAPSDELLGGNSVSGPGIGLNTISGIFLNVISDQLNKIIGGLFKSNKYNISLNTSLYNRDIINNNNTTEFNLSSNVNFSIGRSFFNNRFIISTGVGLDAPLQQQSNIQQSVQLLPDVTLDWLISQSGSIRASFFYRENADYIGTNNNSGPGKARRYGVSLNFRKDFNKLSDLFNRKKKLPVAPPPPPEEEQKIIKKDEEQE